MEPMNASPHHPKVKVNVTLTDPLFVAGSSVTGQMEVDCRADKGLGLSVMMIELFAVQELSSRDHSATSTFIHARRLFQGPGLPPSNAVQAHPLPGDPPLPQHYYQARRGISSFLFSVPIPFTSPSSISFASGLAKVRYELRASVGVVWKGDKRMVIDKKDLDVVESFEEDFGRSEPEAVVVGEHGKIWAQGRIVGGVAVAGESACVELQVKNHSTKKNSGLTVSLMRHLIMPKVPAGDKAPVQITDNLTTVPFRGPEYIIGQGMEGVASLVFDIPKNARGVRGGSYQADDAENRVSDAIFEIKCYIVVKINMGLGSKDIQLDIPVTIAHPNALPEIPPPDQYLPPPGGYPQQHPHHTGGAFAHPITYPDPSQHAYNHHINYNQSPHHPLSPHPTGYVVDPNAGQVWLPPPPALSPHPQLQAAYTGQGYMIPIQTGQVYLAPHPSMSPVLVQPQYTSSPMGMGMVVPFQPMSPHPHSMQQVQHQQHSMQPYQPPPPQSYHQHSAHPTPGLPMISSTHPALMPVGDYKEQGQHLHYEQSGYGHDASQQQQHQYQHHPPPQQYAAQQGEMPVTAFNPDALAHPQSPPTALSPTSLDSPDHLNAQGTGGSGDGVVHSPRPMASPKTSYSQLKTGAPGGVPALVQNAPVMIDPRTHGTLPKSERVEELERLAEQVEWDGGKDLSSGVPAPDGGGGGGGGRTSRHRRERGGGYDEGDGELDEETRQFLMNKTLPAPPVPTKNYSRSKPGEEVPGSKESKGRQTKSELWNGVRRPRVDTYFDGGGDAEGEEEEEEEGKRAKAKAKAKTKAKGKGKAKEKAEGQDRPRPVSGMPGGFEDEDEEQDQLSPILYSPLGRNIPSPGGILVPSTLTNDQEARVLQQSSTSPSKRHLQAQSRLSQLPTSGAGTNATAKVNGNVNTTTSIEESGLDALERRLLAQVGTKKVDLASKRPAVKDAVQGLGTVKGGTGATLKEKGTARGTTRAQQQRSPPVEPLQPQAYYNSAKTPKASAVNTSPTAPVAPLVMTRALSIQSTGQSSDYNHRDSPSAASTSTSQKVPPPAPITGPIDMRSGIPIGGAGGHGYGGHGHASAGDRAGATGGARGDIGLGNDSAISSLSLMEGLAELDREFGPGGEREKRKEAERLREKEKRESERENERREGEKMAGGFVGVGNVLGIDLPSNVGLGLRLGLDRDRDKDRERDMDERTHRAGGTIAAGAGERSADDSDGEWYERRSKSVKRRRSKKKLSDGRVVAAGDSGGAGDMDSDYEADADADEEYKKLMTDMKRARGSGGATTVGGKAGDKSKPVQPKETKRENQRIKKAKGRVAAWLGAFEVQTPPPPPDDVPPPEAPQSVLLPSGSRMLAFRPAASAGSSRSTSPVKEGSGISKPASRVPSPLPSAADDATKTSTIPTKPTPVPSPQTGPATTAVATSATLPQPPTPAPVASNPNPRSSGFVPISTFKRDTFQPPRRPLGYSTIFNTQKQGAQKSVISYGYNTASIGRDANATILLEARQVADLWDSALPPPKQANAGQSGGSSEITIKPRGADSGIVKREDAGIEGEMGMRKNVQNIFPLNTLAPTKTQTIKTYKGVSPPSSPNTAGGGASAGITSGAESGYESGKAERPKSRGAGTGTPGGALAFGAGLMNDGKQALRALKDNLDNFEVPKRFKQLAPRLPGFPPLRQDPELKYDHKSARGGKGGQVTAVAALWSTGVTASSAAKGNEKDKLSNNLSPTSPLNPLRPSPAANTRFQVSPTNTPSAPLEFGKVYSDSAARPNAPHKPSEAKAVVDTGRSPSPTKALFTALKKDQVDSTNIPSSNRLGAPSPSPIIKARSFESRPKSMGDYLQSIGDDPSSSSKTPEWVAKKPAYPPSPNRPLFGDSKSPRFGSGSNAIETPSVNASTSKSSTNLATAALKPSPSYSPAVSPGRPMSADSNTSAKLVGFGVGGKRVKHVIKSPSVPAILSSSHATPTISSTASLARPAASIPPPKVFTPPAPERRQTTPFPVGALAPPFEQAAPTPPSRTPAVRTPAKSFSMGVNGDGQRVGISPGHQRMGHAPPPAEKQPYLTRQRGVLDKDKPLPAIGLGISTPLPPPLSGNFNRPKSPLSPSTSGVNSLVANLTKTVIGGGSNNTNEGSSSSTAKNGGYAVNRPSPVLTSRPAAASGTTPASAHSTGGASGTSSNATPRSPNDNLAFGQARLRDLIKKYQGN